MYQISTNEIIDSQFAEVGNLQENEGCTHNIQFALWLNKG